MTGLVILAAGSSSRLGHPKQNLLFKGKTLLERAAETGIRSACRPVVVVLGANANQIITSNLHIEIIIIQNKQWEQGMASSIKAGITELQQHQGVTSAIIMLCDQPFVSPKLIDEMLKVRLESGRNIVACSYGGVTGVPALFNKALFNDLLSLSGHHGAKKLIDAHPDDVAEVPFEAGSVDIDTLQDYEALLHSK